MPKSTEDNLRDAVKGLADSAPVVMAGKAIAAVGKAAEDAVDTLKRTFRPMLPGQTPPTKKG